MRALVGGGHAPRSPGPVTLDVRAFLVTHPTALALADAGMDPTGQALDDALEAVGAGWADVSHVLITHAHPDHVGGLERVRRQAPSARLMASAFEGLPDAEPLSDGQQAGPLRVVATAGHTAGHLSLVDETHGILFVGDCLGTVGGRLVRAPQQFTSDPVTAEQSLRRLPAFRGSRMLFGHGDELAAPWDSLDALLDR